MKMHPANTRHPERSAGGKVGEAESKDPMAFHIGSLQRVNLSPTGTGEFWVYVLSNERRTVLYIGITKDLATRVFQHSVGEGGGFSRRYQLSSLVYYENFPDPTQAIAREKQLKGWTRAKKLALISKMNPDLQDLAPILFGEDWRGTELQHRRDGLERDPSTTRLVPRRFAQDDRRSLP